MSDGPGEPAGLPPGAEYHAVAPVMRRVWVIEAALWGGALTLGAAAAEFFWLSGQDWYPLPTWAATAAVGLFFAWFSVWHPRRYHETFRYALREWDVLICSGVVWQTRRSVPRMRIQHVDVGSGPIDRHFGVVNLTLYTAGTGDADVSIQGIDPERAEALRDELLPTERVDV